MLIGTGACGVEALKSALESRATVIAMSTRERWTGSTHPRLSYDLGEFDLNLALVAKHQGAKIFLAGDFPKTSAFIPPPISRFLQASEHVPVALMDKRALEGRCLSRGLMPTSLHDVAEQDRAAIWPGPHLAPKGPKLESAWVSRRLDAQGAPPTGQDYLTDARPDTALWPQLISECDTMLWLPSSDRKPFDTAFIDDKLIAGYADAGITDVVVDSDVLLIEPGRLASLCRSRELRLYDAGLGS